MQVPFDNGIAFYVAPGAHASSQPVENLDYDGRTDTPELKVLFYGGLSRYVEKHGPPHRSVKRQLDWDTALPHKGSHLGKTVAHE